MSSLPSRSTGPISAGRILIIEDDAHLAKGLDEARAGSGRETGRGCEFTVQLPAESYR